MSSWVHLFSNFTQEALLFEALAICLLSAGYCAFWVLRKRRLGSIESQVPAGVVKIYLNELIQDAEQMRAQLFGLLRSAGVSVGTQGEPALALQSTGPSLGGAEGAQLATLSASDPATAQKIAEMEARMAEQAKAMQSLLVEKQKIEKDLAEARANAGAGKASGAPESSAALTQLQQKIGLLEGKLAEYSVIEDDLANLKKLQQENSQLKAALQGRSVDAPAGAVAAAPAVPVSETPRSQATQAAPEPIVEAAEAVAASASEPQATAAAPQADAFEGLVDQVEQSLQPTAEATAATGEPAAPAADAAASPEAAPLESVEKSDADLVAEFEKMLRP
jgi:hypothetical protein